jgi:hypothetical protein
VSRLHILAGLSLILFVGAAGCGDPGSGNLQVLLDPEESITEGLDPGTGGENIVDGWTVRFDKYLIAVGHIQVGRSQTSIAADDDTMHVVDMMTLPPSGFALAHFENLTAQRWSFFAYETGSAAGGLRDESVEQADFDEMAANGWTYLVEGTLTHPEGESCPPGGACAPATSVAFRLGVSSVTDMLHCESEGINGVSVVANTTTAVAVSIHGDHMFFDSFPTGPEIVHRRAQWLANSDLNQDGVVTNEELLAIPAQDVLPASHYSFGGSPIDIVTAHDFLRAQMHTQGHFQGEGHCSWCLEGEECVVEDDHGHAH